MSGYEPDARQSDPRPESVVGSGYGRGPRGIRRSDRTRLARRFGRSRTRATEPARSSANEFDLLLDDFGLSINPEDGERYRADPSLVGGVLTGQQNGIDVPRDGSRDAALRRSRRPPSGHVRHRPRGDLLRPGARLHRRLGELPQHLAPDSLEGGLLASYDPVPRPSPATSRRRGERWQRRGTTTTATACATIPSVAGSSPAVSCRSVPRGDDESLSVRTQPPCNRDRASREGPRHDLLTLGKQFNEGRLAMMLEVSTLYRSPISRTGAQFFTFLYSSADRFDRRRYVLQQDARGGHPGAAPRVRVRPRRNARPSTIGSRRARPPMGSDQTDVLGRSWIST